MGLYCWCDYCCHVCHIVGVYPIQLDSFVSCSSGNCCLCCVSFYMDAPLRVGGFAYCFGNGVCSSGHNVCPYACG